MSEQSNGQFNKKVSELTRLAAAQIRVAVTESMDNVDGLSLSFTEIVNQDKQIREKIEQFPDDPSSLEIKNEIAILSSELRTNINNAIVAFQFYDRLCQRLDHTSSSLKKLSEIEDHQKQTSLDEVIELRENVYNHFTMIEERQLFDAVLGSKDFEHAIEEYSVARAASLENVDEDDDIEFF